MNNNKQRLFEMMERVDSSFKKIDEVTPKMAGVTINRNLGGDLRTQQINKDAITSLFNKYIGKDIPFFTKVREGDQPTKFQLVEVTFGRDMGMRTEYSALENGSDYVLKLHFFNPNGEESDSPFSENKKEFTATYILNSDSYDNVTKTYFYNQYAINLFLFAAMTVRKAYFHAFPIYNTLNAQTYYTDKKSIDQAATEEKMKTNLNKRSFRQFQYDSKNLENRTTDKPEPTEYF